MIYDLRDSCRIVQERAIDVLTHLKDVLENDKPRIHRSMIEKVTALADSLPGLDLQDDEKFAEIAKGIQTQLGSLSIEKLREEDSFREDVVDDADNLIHKLENLYGPSA